MAGTTDSHRGIHTLTSTVEVGAQRGRQLGFPTANLHPVGVDAWPGGVYAGVTRTPEDLWWPSAINVGTRPTFTGGEAEVTVEVHLIGFDGDLYGQTITVRFLDRLRDEMRFDSIEALTEQLRVDVQQAWRAVESSVSAEQR